MKLSQFKFKLPEELIAQHPSKNRDDARLLVLHKKSGEIEHKNFVDILDYFGKDDLFVFNDTQVFPAMMNGTKEKTEANIEVFLLRELNKEFRLWDVLVEPARKIRVGNKLYFGPDDSLVAEVIDNTTSRGRTVRFLFDGTHEEFKRVLFSYGRTPLPTYIKRPAEKIDTERYQTIFAAQEGAVVAPFAGLHFSPEIIKRLTIRGINFGYVTLHCSLSLFRNIDVEDLTKHKMDSEQMEVSEELCNLFNSTYEAGNSICAVGTSTFRALETASTVNNRVKPYGGWTNRFIFPPYNTQSADSLLTNFHMPLSTMLMNVATFGGYDLVMKTYETAIKEGYKFGCYGDAMLVLKNS
ncbi:MAG: tRNA preQ1(34) S-adenosylmethionine ribosyltransferase-isomerase QueA [Prevotellaceae bacterium]|jgi:S-adenosylmethionine:tRNA ribosyltransferase-isomerase|nr:tRNA preQ1(34) S-adenosylmethionine ribosyltransferase-isomerase QueA [Prevotellaceae bacterium]